MNILENAVKYSNEKGKILIQASTDYQLAKMIIKDTGIGIGKKHLAHIFERFYRVDGTNHEGSGLGLSIAAALVKAHKGTIDVVSQKGEGTTFIISLPLAHPKLVPVKSKKDPKKSSSRIKILPISLIHKNDQNN